MAPPKAGKKESLLDVCTTTLNLGNTIAVHVLEYLNDARTARVGFKDLAIEFLEASRPLFPTKTGLIEAAKAGTQFPEATQRDSLALLRQYHTNFVVLDQMVKKLLDSERKHGFSKFGNGFKMMFADTDIEKLKISLTQCRTASSKDVLVVTWARGETRMDVSSCIGYTALAAVLERPDPTRRAPSSPQPPQSHKPQGAVTVTDIPAEHQQGMPLRPALKQYSNGSHRPAALMSQSSSRSSPPDCQLPSIPRDSFTTPGMSPTSLRAHTETHLSSGQRSRVSDALSDISPPSSIGHEDILNNDFDHRPVSPIRQAVRVRVDPATQPRWRPSKSTAAGSMGSKAALLVAVQEMNHEMVEHLLDCGAPPNYSPEISLLRIAITNRDIACIRLLLLFGADPNLKDKDGSTPLFAAVKEFFIEAAQLLLKYGADPNASSAPSGETPLATAIADARATFAHLLLKHGADVHTVMASAETPWTAAMNKTTALNLIELMLTYDDQVDSKNGHGETALFKAINVERIDLVNLLLDKGANPNLPGPKHMLWPAVHKPQILQILLENGADLKKAPGCLELAVSTINTESVQILIAHGVDVNAKKDGIFTPLCTAIRDNREHLVDILLEAGADPNEMASEYPAWKCVTHQRTHLLPKVLAAGADAENPPGIVECAVASKNKSALHYLLDHGVNPNTRNAAGCTALTTAIRNQNAEALDELLHYGADPGVRGQEWPATMVCLKLPSGDLETRLTITGGKTS